MVLQPELLLLDEPTAYLDRLQTHHLQEELERIHRGGTTIVIATHDLNFAYTWADWFFILNDGQLVMEGEANEIFRRRELLEDLHLGVPLLWEVWEALSSRFRSQNDSSYPRTVAELRERIL
jgi:cobalt/nickel transport system ATP-binding protein